MNKKIIRWQYTHHLNNRSSTQRTKEGEYFGKVKHTYKYWQDNTAKQMACVQFDGNKKCSFVPFEELYFIKTKLTS